MTEAEVRAQIDVMISKINSSVVDIKWNLAELGTPRTRYVWFQGVPVLVWLNDYLQHWWLQTGQIWYDDIDHMVNMVGRTIYEIYESLLDLEVRLNALVSDNMQEVGEYVGFAMHRIIDFVANEVDILEHWISFEVESLETYINGELDQVYTDVNAVILEQRTWVQGEIAKVNTDLETQIAEIKGHVDGAIDLYRGEVDVLFSDLYTDLEANVASIRASIASLASDAMDWIIEKVGAVWTWLQDTGNEIYQFVNQKISDLTNYVSQWVLDITEYISGIVASLKREFALVYQKITDSVNWVMDQVKIITDAIKEALETAIEAVKSGLDWFNQYFTLTLAFPEIGMLSALVREEDDFDHFKPYWQAFIARLLT